MSIIKFVEKTPDVYTKYSRDFQLLCRLYDAVWNSVKFNSDTIPYILDASKCRSNILQLLQTKLGFYTDVSIDDEALRYVLKAFPIMVKNKGSLIAVQYAVNVWLKINHLQSKVIVYQVNQDTLINNHLVPNHTLVIGIESTTKDLSILEQMLKYILPIGYGYYIYFYKNMSLSSIKTALNDNVDVLFISENINSQIRGNDTNYEEVPNRLINAVGTLEIFNSTDKLEGNDLFLGIKSEELTEGSSGQSYIYNNKLYYYNNQWNECTFKGVYDSQNAYTDYDIALFNMDKQKNFIMKNNVWETCNFKGFIDEESLPTTASNNDLYIIVSNNDGEVSCTYKAYINNAWQTLIYKGEHRVTDNIENYNNNDVILINTPYYQLKQGNEWIYSPFAYYIYNYKNITGGMS